MILMSNGQRILTVWLSELKTWNIEIPEWQRFLNEYRIHDLFRNMRNYFQKEGTLPLQTGIVMTEVKHKFFTGECLFC